MPAVRTGKGSGETERPTILVVDDEKLSREFVQTELGGDYRVLKAATAEEALRTVERERVDLVLMDVILGGVGGYEACREIKSRGTGEDFLPVLFLTARSQHEDRCEGWAAGGDDFLTKPVDGRELRIRIESYLRLRDQDRTIRNQARSLQQANERLRASNEIGGLLSTSLRLGEPHGWVVEAITRGFGLELAAIGQMEAGRLIMKAVAPSGDFERAMLLLATDSARCALETGRAVRGVDDGGVRVCWVPVSDREGKFGLLVAAARDPDALGEEDVKALETICLELAITLRNRQFVEGIRTHTEVLGSAVRERTASLERQIRLTSLILDALPVSLHVVDRSRTIVAWNRQRELGSRGVLREQALGKSLFEIFDRQSRESIESELRRVFDHGESLRFERDSNADGELRHYRIQKLPMWLEPGDVTHVLSIGEDVTEHRHMERSLLAAEKMAALGRLSAGVAHEINNPLATIMTCADGLVDRLRDLPADFPARPEFHEYLEIIEQEAHRAKRITEDLLEFSRAKPSVRQECALSSIVERTLNLVKHHAGFKKIQVDRRFDAALPPVAVDEEAIVQVFVALILNALDAMPDGGRLSLTASPMGGEVLCDVRDTGIGIDPADLPHIFEPFFTTKPSGRGTGLGLAVCYGIIQSHGGRIEVDSTPGMGARFTLALPVASAKGAFSSDEAIPCRLPMPSDS